MKAIYLIANGDLRIDANQKCEAAQAAMEKQLVSALENDSHPPPNSAIEEVLTRFAQAGLVPGGPIPTDGMSK